MEISVKCNSNNRLIFASKFAFWTIFHCMWIWAESMISFFLNVQGDEHNWQKHNKSGRCQIVWWFQWSSHRSFKVTVLSLEKLFIVYSTFLPKVFIWVKSYWSHITGMWCPPNPIWRGLIMLVKFKVKVIVISVYLVKRTNAVKEHQLLANWNVWFWRN